MSFRSHRGRGAAVALALGAMIASSLAPLGAAADRRVEIRVDHRGFHPAEVRATRGEALTLVFLRTEERGCGREVVIPGSDIRRALPVGERVRITITPNADRLTFTCGMGHMRGTIVVEEDG